ncbi:MAG TPA: DUF2791 family P-loop domain-containing protein, partial [Accumulibacter sp.]|nr:DUF2791 family P-loop domain-containing protein [Accumulibacter sp.]
MSAPTADNLRWFNPRQMDDDTVLALAVGRERLVETFLRDVRQRLREPAGGLHWLVTGNYGAGKSYFLRLAQAQARRRLPAPGVAPSVRVVLLPEELKNVREPHDLIDEIRRLRAPQPETLPRRGATWRDVDPARSWQTSLDALWAEADETLLVVGIENLKQVLDRAFGDDLRASLLRTLLLHEPRLMLLASAVDGTLDEKYRQRLFRQFRHHPLPAWGPQQHRDYLTLRARQRDTEASAPQLARIDAYSRFTGGNARVAALLADAILGSQDMVAAADDLNTILDWLTKYYAGQLEAMPDNSAALFDALLGGGEPASQSTVAERVHARQSDIARAFAWLVDSGHVSAERLPGAKETLYRASDRLFVQWYRMRHVDAGVRPPLAVLTELIADTVAFADKWRYALRLNESGRAGDAQVFAELGLCDAGISWPALRACGMSVEHLLVAAQRVYLQPEPAVSPGFVLLSHELALLERHPSNAGMARALEESYQLAAARDDPPGGRADGRASGRELADLVKNSLSLSPTEKLRVLDFISGMKCSAFQWDELAQTFRNEVVEFDKLRPTESETIDRLTLIGTAGWRLPLPISWHTFSEEGSSGQEIRHAGGLVAAALSAAAAANAVLQWRRLSPAEAKCVGGPEEGAHFVTRQALIHLLTNLVFKHGGYAEVDTLAERLLAAWPTERRRTDAADLGTLWMYRAEARQQLDDAAGSVTMARRALTLFDEAGDRGGSAWANEKLGWNLGETGDRHAAIAAHDAAAALWRDNGHRAWPLGQG